MAPSITKGISRVHLKSKSAFVIVFLILLSATQASILDSEGSKIQFWTLAGFSLQRTNYTPKVGNVSVPILLWKAGGFGGITAPPTVADIDGDGTIEVLFGDIAFNFMCVNGSDGRIKWIFKTNSPISMTPALKDVNGDGKLEIFFAEIGEPFGPYNLYSFAPDGTLLWSYSAGYLFSLGSPAVDDVDGDGIDEVIVGNMDRRFHFVDARTGKLQWSYECSGYTDCNTPAIADLDGDGVKEIVVSDYDYGGNVYAIRSDRKLKWKFSGEGGFFGITIDDIDLDGRQEVLACSNDGSLYSFTDDGKFKWRFTTGGSMLSYNGIGVADLDHDGKKEIVFGSADGKIYCVKPDGEIKFVFQADSEIYGSPALGDFDADGFIEIVFGTANGYVYLLEHDGVQKWVYQTLGTAGRVGITAEDTNGDGLVEILVPSHDGYLYCFTSSPVAQLPSPPPRPGAQVLLIFGTAVAIASACVLVFIVRKQRKVSGAPSIAETSKT